MTRSQVRGRKVAHLFAGRTVMPSPTPPRLADGIALARLDQDVIVLDIFGDRYTRIGGMAARLLTAIDAGSAVDPHDPLIKTLEARGLITRAAPCPAPWRRPDELQTPEASALECDDHAHGISLGDFGIALDYTISRWVLRHRPLARVLLDLATCRSQRAAGDIVALARTFDRGRRLMPFTPRCLPDALAFARYARRRGHAVSLVFGVKGHPFEAHCWAQSGALVLTDPLERVRRFQPILVL